MNFSRYKLNMSIVFVLTIVLAMPLEQAAAFPAQQVPSNQETQSVPSVQSDLQASDSQAEKVDADSSQNGAAIPNSPVPARPRTADQSEQSASSQPGLDQQQSGEPKPVGSAVAPYEKTTGVAASRPAGAVIAPAKQRRARSILIKVSIVVGTAVAVGTVVALSRGSSSRPN